MVRRCSIISCKSEHVPGNGITCHAFPTKDADLKKKWIDAIPADLLNKDGAMKFICSLHFPPENYHNTPTGRNFLKKDAIPTCFKVLPHSEPKKTNKTMITNSNVRRGELKQCAEENTTDDGRIIDIEDKDMLPEVAYNKSDASTQTSPKKLKPTPRMETLVKKVDVLQKRLKRRDATISNMEEVIKILKDDSAYSEGIQDILEKRFSGDKLQLLLNEVNNNDVTSNNRQYSDEVKQFALTLYFYSPKAYELIRKYLYLPHPGTMRKWMSAYDCEPGLLTEVFNYLETETQKSSHLRNVSLVFDSMAIRVESSYDVAKDKHAGFVNYGGLIEGDSDKLAKEALVFEVVSYTHKFKCPVAYVFTTGVSANTQAELLRQIIVKLYNVGVTVRSLTCDGAEANFCTFKYLGCDFSSNNLDELKTSFTHPCGQSQIHCILDPCHMVKLCRNTVGEKNDIESQSGKISFEFIKALHDVQEEQDLTLANKLSSAHMGFKRKKMKVRLAVQTISSGVADAIDYLRACKEPGFDDSEATVEFIRIFDRLFDMMNSRNSFGKGFKSPLRPENLQYFRNVFAESRAYISGLKIEDVPVLKHGRRTFALGFAINTHSFINLAEDLFNLADNPLKFFLAYKCSQDHIELTFCCIRSRGGWNNNPNCLQFKWALRQLLFRNKVEPSVNANCLGDATDIMPILEFRSSKRSLTDATLDTDNDNQELQDHLLEALDKVELSALQKNILYYITGNIIRNVIDKIACQDCQNILLDDEQDKAADHCYTIDMNKHSSFVSFVSRGSLVFPSNTAFHIVMNAERAFRAELHTGMIGKPNFKRNMISTVMHKLMSTNSLFFSREHPINNVAEDEDLHELQLIKILVSSYANLRIKSHAKKMTHRYLGARINDRQHLHNTILFYNI